MSVTRTRYVKELEERMAKGKSFEKAHKKAAEVADVRPERKRSDRNKDIVKKVARKLYEVFYGKEAYAKKKFTPSRKRKIPRVKAKVTKRKYGEKTVRKGKI